jgi:hypothetical protein
VKAQWYDPSNGAWIAIAGSPFQNSGTQNFATPGKNHDGEPDWVLSLDVPGDSLCAGGAAQGLERQSDREVGRGYIGLCRR